MLLKAIKRQKANTPSTGQARSPNLNIQHQSKPRCREEGRGGGTVEGKWKGVLKGGEVCLPVVCIHQLRFVGVYFL